MTASSTQPTTARLSINQATTETSSTEELLDACAQAGVGYVAPWRHKFIDGDVRRTRRALDARSIRASSLCRGGFFTGTRPPAEAASDNRRAVEEAAELGSPVLVLVCGPVTETGAAAALEAITRGIEALLPHAIDHDVILAVEPFHPMFAAERSAIIRLDQATDLVTGLDHPNLGIAVDTYHVWWDPDLAQALERASAKTVAVHVADWLVPTQSLLQGRGLPGDGIIDLAGILENIARGGYDGPVEVEVLNGEVWSRQASDVVLDVQQRLMPLLERIGAAV
ncbi:MAG: xylose isomerase [Nocardioides sp.]|nr:xylose isomerase [Nocardioides sp.]